MATLKIKVVDADKLIFQLEEPAQAGDIIDLNNLNTIDFHSWNQKVFHQQHQAIEKEVQKETDVIRAQLNNEFQQEINKLNQSITILTTEKAHLIEQHKVILEKEKEKIENKNQQEINQINQAHILEVEQLQNKLKNADNLSKLKYIELINKLENDNKDLIQKHQLDLQTKMSESKNTYNELKEQKNNEINELKNKITLYENEKLAKDHEWELKIKTITEKVENEKNTLQEKYDILLREKNLLSTKSVGEDLETWCYNQYHTLMDNLADDCTFEKANTIYDLQGMKSKTGNKADFLFCVYDRPVYDNHKILLGTVTLEMKTAITNSDKKNISFLPKLAQDMQNTHADFGILVTELEPDTPIIINKAPGYNNIFIVRPNSMVPLLTILRSVILKQKEIKKQEIFFQDSINILNQWEEFKTKIFETNFKNIQAKLEDIQKSVESAQNSLSKILDAKQIILNTHLNAIRNKIENFKIKKLCSSIDRLNASQSPTKLASDQAKDESIEIHAVDNNLIK